MTEASDPPDRIAVVTMVMRDDLPHALVSLASVRSQLSDSVRHFVLINDHPNSDLEELLAAPPNREIINAGSPLGVPRGRNLLFRRALEWGASHVVVFDDDLIAPADYVERLIEAYKSLEDEVGIVGATAPTVLNYERLHNVVLPGGVAAALDRVEATEVDTVPAWWSRFASLEQDPGPAAIEHMGIVDWQDHYLGVGRRSANRWLQKLESRHVSALPPVRSVLANSQQARLQVGRSPLPLEVDTLPGGVWCVGREALTAVGMLDEDFSPFGFEDAEWCIRARKHQLRNFVLPSVPVLHDYQKRMASRDERQTFESRGRARGLLITRHADPATWTPLVLIALAEVLDAATGQGALAFFDSLFRSLLESGAIVSRSDGAEPQMRVEGQTTADLLELESVRISWPQGQWLHLSANIRLDSEGSRSGRVSLGAAGRRVVSLLAQVVLGEDIEPETREVIAWTVAALTTSTELSHVIADCCPGELSLSLDFAIGIPQPVITVRHSC